MGGFLPYVLILIPFFLALGAKGMFPQKFTWGELAIQTGIASVLSIGIIITSNISAVTDVELWNGQVESKRHQTEDCPSGWRDSKDWFCSEYRTRIVDNGPRQCTSRNNAGMCMSWHQPTKTQYKYDYDWEKRWYVETDLKRFQIRRVDSQGVQMPPFWGTVNPGDPVSIQNTYVNWVRAASNSIFHEDGITEEQYKDLIPSYPIEIYNYYKVNRLINVGSATLTKDWNLGIANILRELGPKRQMNLVIVDIGVDVGHDFPYAVRRAWKGFKKNDAVLFVWHKNSLVTHAEVLSWSKNPKFDIDLRNAILKKRGQSLDKDETLKTISDIAMKSFERRSMEEFEFLKNDIPIPTWIITVSIILSLFVSGVLIYRFTRD